MEPIFRMSQTVEAMHVDRFQRLKPSAILYFAQEAAAEHCKVLQLDWETLASRDLFWAIIRQKVEITRLPKCGETITIETWPMPTTRSAFPRATVAYDETGKELFSVMGLWVLMNLKTRTMMLPGKSGIDLAGITRGCELSAPGSLSPKELEHTMVRTVRFSELDRNGHMNNTRYMDWLTDLLPSDFHRDHPIKNFTICYANEALENQEISLSWQLTEEGVLQADAHRSKTDVSGGKDRVFAAQVGF